MALALAVESCCATTIAASPAKPSGRLRSGGRPPAPARNARRPAPARRARCRDQPRCGYGHAWGRIDTRRSPGRHPIADKAALYGDRIRAALLGGTTARSQEKHPQRAVFLGRLGHADIVACKGLAVLQRQRGGEGLSQVDTAWRRDRLDVGGSSDMRTEEISLAKHGIERLVDRPQVAADPQR